MGAMEVARLRCVIAAAERRRDRARACVDRLRKEFLSLEEAQETADMRRFEEAQQRQQHPPLGEPLLSPSSLRIRSNLSGDAGTLPCEFWPLVQSAIVRTLVPEELLLRLRAQIEVSSRNATRDTHVGLWQGSIDEVDQRFVELLLELCSVLGWSVLHSAVRCKLESVTCVVQREGDYSPVDNSGISPFGFSALLDVQLPKQLQEKDERPPRGGYGWHDGIHSLVWKSDSSTDRESLIQPGILQLELVPGYLYVFPQWVNTYTWPFEGAGERQWLRARVALVDCAA